MVSCIDTVWVQEDIHRAAYRFQQDLESVERVVVGLNRYAIEEPPPRLFALNPEVERNQKRRLAEVRAARDEDAVRRTLAAIEVAARGEESLLPPILEAVRARAGVGEISVVVRGVFGTFD